MNALIRNRMHHAAARAFVPGILLCLSLAAALSVDAKPSPPTLNAGSPPADDLDVDQHLSKAAKLQNAGDLEAALRETTRAYELAPDRLQVLLAQAGILVLLQRYDQAIPFLRESLAMLLQPNDLDRAENEELAAHARFLLATSLLATSRLNDRSQWPEARRLLRETITYFRSLKGPLATETLDQRLAASAALIDLLDRRRDRAEIVRLGRQMLDEIEPEMKTDPARSRPVWAAIKILLAELADDDRVAERYYRAALTEYRLLPGKPSENTRFRIAEALNYLGFRASRNRRHWREAEKQYRQALKIRREQATNGSAEPRSLLAATLNNIGNLLAHWPGRHDEAEPFYAEAIAIRKQLAETGLPRYRFDYAKTLYNRANSITDHKEAERLYRGALTIFRQLARENPTAYRAGMLVPLGALARELMRDPARHAEAQSLLEEAVSLGEPLIDDSRDPLMRSTHAQNLVDLAEMIGSDHDQHKRAEPYFRRALGICRSLSNQASAGCDSARMEAAFGLAQLLSRQPTHHAEARALYRESLKQRRAAPDRDEHAQLARLAMTLHGLAKLERDLPGKRAIAEARLREAISLFDKVAQWNPVFLPLLTQTQRDLAALVGGNGKNSENTEKLLREALTRDRQRPQGDPERLLAVTLDLGNLAELTESRPDRRNEAESLYREALRLLDQASARDTDTRFRRSWLLYKLGNLLVVDPEHANEAIRLLNQSLDLYRELAGEDPGQFESSLADTLFSLGRAWYFNLRDKAKAVTYLREAARTGAAGAKKNPEARGDPQATALNLLALADEDRDRFDRCELLQQARRFARSDKIRKEGARVEKQLRCDVWH